MGGIDDFIRQAEEDELEDAVQLPPIQYAKMRGLRPQRVYAAIRNRKLEDKYCLCGRKVVVVDDADKFFKLGTWKPGASVTATEEEEVPGSDMGSGEQERGQA